MAIIHHSFQSSLLTQKMEWWIEGAPPTADVSEPVRTSPAAQNQQREQMIYDKNYVASTHLFLAMLWCQYFREG